MTTPPLLVGTDTAVRAALAQQLAAAARGRQLVIGSTVRMMAARKLIESVRRENWTIDARAHPGTASHGP
jgi:hypothetical protein